MRLVTYGPAQRWLTHRLAGTLVFLAVMFLLFQSIFTAARPFMRWIDARGAIWPT
ncbi:MAG: hypothetical protein U0736_21405 [Gemmataceae bacterium]